MSYRAVLFDLDGTLIDTAPDFASVLNRQLERHGRPPLPYPVIRNTVSQGARAVVQLGFGELDIESPEFENLRQEFLSDYLQHLADESCLFEGMDELLRNLESQGVAWGIVTNKPSLYTWPLLRALNLKERCSSVVCPDMLNRSKPDPEGLFKACAEIGIKPAEAIYVGDHRRDIDAGKNAGMRTIAVSYGYILPGEDPADWNADHLSHSVAELVSQLNLMKEPA